MNLKTSTNNYNISFLNEDIILIKETESVIWDLHYANNVFELFKNVKARTQFFNELFDLYQKHNENYKKLSEELLSNYPEIFQVVFKNNYHKVLEAFQKLSNLLTNQYVELNISENLLNEKQRETILNGNKIREDQSEFTTLIFLLLENLKGVNEETKSILNEKTDSVNFNQKQENNTEKKVEIEENSFDAVGNLEVEKVKELNKKSLEEESIEVQNLETKGELVENSVLNQSDNSDFEKLEDLKEKNSQIQIEEIEDVHEEIKKEEEQENFVLQEEQKQTEDEKLNELIVKYFAYQDSPEISDEEKKDILNNSIKSNSARRYAQILLDLEEKQELDIYEMLAKKLFTDTLIKLQNYDIEPEKFTLSTSWVMWDIAKQIYYMKNPHKSTNEYDLADPLYKKEKQQEIIDRHIGWIVYKQMTTGRLDNILNKIKNSVYGKRIIEFMISKPKPGLDSLPSHKLAKLGECVRLGLEN